jgi:peptidoglycan/LPS O-acetylase OafA/YrhL
MSSSTASTPSWLDRGRIPSLDGLRAVAILLVIFAHSSFYGDDLLALRMLRGRSGFLGVQIFFVLSGFLITTLMLREVQRSGRLHLGNFYLRRALRIVPVYAAYLVLVLLLQAAGQVRLADYQWAAALTWTVNLVPGKAPWALSHFWSLCVEEHFYLLWPLLMVALPPRWCRRAVPLCLAGAFLLRWVLLLVDPKATIDLLTWTRIDDIAVGCGLAFLAREAHWRHRLQRLAGSGWRLALLLAVFTASQVVCSRVVGGRLLRPGALEGAIAVANTINSLTVAVLMWLMLTRPGSLPGRVLNHPVAVTLGVLSYSAYLWHLPLCEKGPAWMVAFPQNLVFIFAAALASYKLIEQPFLRLKDRLGAEAPRGAAPMRTPLRERKAAAEAATAPASQGCPAVAE